jgi:pantoate--beta-alanine ligase
MLTGKPFAGPWFHALGTSDLSSNVVRAKMPSVVQVRSWSRKCRAEGLKVGLVPTMGYLHDGHLSLVRTAAEQSDRIVVSVYVNESQFAPGEDLAIYPRDTEGDLAKVILLHANNWRSA